MIPFFNIFAKTKNNDTTKSQSSNYEKYCKLKKIIRDIFPSIIALVALIISITALCNSNSNFQIENRAYLIVENPTGFQNFIKDKISIEVQYDINNFGKIPAYNVNMFGVCEIFDSTFNS